MYRITMLSFNKIRNYTTVKNTKIRLAFLFSKEQVISEYSFALKFRAVAEEMANSIVALHAIIGISHLDKSIQMRYAYYCM